MAAINQLKKELSSTDVVVVIFHDHGTRYVGKLFNDDWMKQGFYKNQKVINLFKSQFILMF